MNMKTLKDPTMLSITTNDERTVYRYYQQVDGVWVPYKRRVFRNNVIRTHVAPQPEELQWRWR